MRRIDLEVDAPHMPASTILRVHNMSNRFKLMLAHKDTKVTAEHEVGEPVPFCTILPETELSCLPDDRFVLLVDSCADMPLIQLSKIQRGCRGVLRMHLREQLAAPAELVYELVSTSQHWLLAIADMSKVCMRACIDCC